MNISIAIMVTRIKNEKGILLKSLMASVYSNFVIITFIVFLTTRPFLNPSNIEDAMANYMHAVGDMFLTGNWILPMLFIVVKKTKCKFMSHKCSTQRK
jgi:formate-dependent nitrite reductase membrane component NrfD